MKTPLILLLLMFALTGTGRTGNTGFFTELKQSSALHLFVPSLLSLLCFSLPCDYERFVKKTITFIADIQNSFYFYGIS